MRFAIIGGSSGATNDLLKLVEAIGVRPTPPIVVVTHRQQKEHSDGFTRLLQTRCAHKVMTAQSGDRLSRNTIYICPGGSHCVIDLAPGIRITQGAAVNFNLPSIDKSMESAVRLFGADVIGVLLSGANNDGAKGLKTIFDAGGFTWGLLPELCEFNEMVRSAAAIGAVKQFGSHAEIADFLVEVSCE